VAPRAPGLAERLDLGVRPSRLPVPAFGDDLAGAHEDGANARVRAGAPEATSGQGQRAAHELLVSAGEHARDTASGARQRQPLSHER
jgi:hypothetical protein